MVEHCRRPAQAIAEFFFKAEISRPGFQDRDFKTGMSGCPLTS